METWILLTSLAFLVAGTIKGTIGLGLPITAIGLMTLFLDARLAITLMVFPILFTNMWQVYRGGNVIASAKRYWMYGVSLAISLLITTFFTNKVSIEFLVGLIGVTVILFCTVNLLYKLPPLNPRYDRVYQISGGILSGFLGGFTTIWAPLIAIYLLAKQVDKDEFVRGTGFLFLMGSFPLLLGFSLNGMLTPSIAGISAIMIIPTLAGFSLGEKVREQVSSGIFRNIVLVSFMLFGLNLIRKAFFV